MGLAHRWWLTGHLVQNIRDGSVGEHLQVPHLLQVVRTHSLSSTLTMKCVGQPKRVFSLLHNNFQSAAWLLLTIDTCTIVAYTGNRLSLVLR